MGCRTHFAGWVEMTPPFASIWTGTKWELCLSSKHPQHVHMTTSCQPNTVHWTYCKCTTRGHWMCLTCITSTIHIVASVVNLSWLSNVIQHLVVNVLIAITCYQWWRCFIILHIMANDLTIEFDGGFSRVIMALIAIELLWRKYTRHWIQWVEWFVSRHIMTY